MQWIPEVANPWVRPALRSDLELRLNPACGDKGKIAHPGSLNPLQTIRSGESRLH